jgi:hypothetical protein
MGPCKSECSVDTVACTAVQPIPSLHTPTNRVQGTASFLGLLTANSPETGDKTNMETEGERQTKFCPAQRLAINSPRLAAQDVTW